MRLSDPKLLLLLLGLTACGPGGCASCFQATPGPLPEAERIYEGFQIRITPDGFAAGAGNMATALTAIQPSYTFVSVGPFPVKAGDFDGTFCPFGCYIFASLTPPNVDRETPDKLLLKSSFDVNSSASFQGTPSCSLSFSARLHATVVLKIDQEPVSKNLSVTVDEIRLPIVPADFAVSSNNCNVTDYSPIQDALAGMGPSLVNAIQSDVQYYARQQFCLECDDYLDGCPAGATCNTTSNICELPGGKCMAEPMGIHGAVDLHALAPGNYSRAAGMELHVVAGQKSPVAGDPIVDPTTGANFRFYGGVVPPTVPPDCVPPGVPPVVEADRVDLDGEAQRLAPTLPALSQGFHLGISLSEALMTRLLQGAWAGGAFCIEASSALSSLISAESLSAVLPSIGVVADKNAPAMVQLRLKVAPRALAGAGEYGWDGNGKWVLVKPLVIAELKELELSVYTVIEGRYARVLAVEADARLPLGIEQVPDNLGAPRLLPVVGNLDGLAEKLTVTRNELLAEDEETVKNAVRTMLSLAQPVVLDMIQSFPLPSSNGLQLELAASHGVGPRAEPDSFEAVGLFMKVRRGAPSSMSARTEARLVELVDPTPGAKRVVARVDARAAGDDASEVQYRVDGGPWSTFQPAGTLDIDHPRLGLRGTHQLELRARYTGAWASLDLQPVKLTLEVKRPRPVVQLKTRELGGEVLDDERVGRNADAESGCSTAGGELAIAVLPLLAALRVRRRASVR